MSLPTLASLRKKYENTTMYKNNSGLIAKTKVSQLKKGLCLTESFVSRNSLLLIYETVVKHTKKNTANDINKSISLL